MLRPSLALLVSLLLACGAKNDKTAEPEPPVDPKAEQSPAAAVVGSPGQTPADALPALLGKAPGAQEGKHVWSKKIGGAGSDAARSVAVDGDGNYIVTGYFSESVDFGGGPLESVGDKDVFLVKYDAAGAHLWSLRFGGLDEDIGQSLEVDSKGNIVITGTFKGEADFGGGKPFASIGMTDAFVARYSPQGKHLWSRRVGGENEDRGYDLAIDSADNVIVTGYFTEPGINLGGEDLHSAGHADIFVVKYAPTSEHIWSWRIGGKVDDLGRAVAVDADDNIVLAGDFHEDIVLGGTTLTSAGNADVLLAKFDPDGKHLWSKRFGSYFHDFTVGIALDNNGHIAVTGGFEQNIDFGGGELKGEEKKEIFLTKLTGDGQHLWSKRFGSRDDDVGSGLAVDSYGNVYFSGWFWKGIDFGGGTLESAGQNDIVLAKYAPDGSFVWAKRFGDAGGDFGRAVAVDKTGSVVLAGTFRGTVDFGGDPIEFSGTKEKSEGDAFVAKFSP